MAQKLEKPTTERFLPQAAFTTHCVKHEAEVGVPCWTIPSAMSRKVQYGICDDRLRKAGFTGEIDPRSLQLGPAGKGRRN